MDVLAKAKALEESGRRIFHLEVGQPQSGASEASLAAVRSALGVDKLGYTAAAGEQPLRAAIAEMYKNTYGAQVPVENIHVTMGSSCGFTLAFLSAFDAGEAVAIPSCSYPCYRNILRALGVDTVPIAVDDEYKVTASMLRHEVERRAAENLPALKGLILSSPANPTGVLLSPEEVQELCSTCEELGIQFISDEIYHGLVHSGAPRAASALEFTEKALVINSFSKFYSMTGWRVGWLVAPRHLTDAINRLNQNLFISAPTVSQRAALASLQPEAKAELQGHVERYGRNRELVLDTLKKMGISKVAPSHGAFYAYFSLKDVGVKDSAALCDAALEEVGLALTPGLDFEFDAEVGGEHVRISYAGSTEEIGEAMQILENWLPTYLARLS